MSHRVEMKSVSLRFVLLVAVASALAGCDPASNFAHEAGVSAAPASARGERVQPNGGRAGDAFGVASSGLASSPGLSCPCFSRASLSNDDKVLTAASGAASDYYLFFDVFNYYGLDARRTEARALVSTSAGLLEEVAAVYITYGSGPDDLHLICHRQEVVQDPVSGEPSYRYETLAPSVEQAESCRQAIVASVGDQEDCQGAACGIPYVKEQLSPDYPPYHDGFYRTPDALLDAMQRKVEEVGRMLQIPA